jgi:hypothetical protein
MAIDNTDVLIANLSGCMITEIDVCDQRVMVSLDDRYIGHLRLICDEAHILNTRADYLKLTERADWTRRIDWADVLAGNTLYLALANGSCLAIQAHGACLEKAR